MNTIIQPTLVDRAGNWLTATWPRKILSASLIIGFAAWMLVELFTGGGNKPL